MDTPSRHLVSEPLDSWTRVSRAQDQSMPGSTNWQPGAVVAREYEVVRKLGQGGMGTVHLLKERRTGQLIAAKTPKDANKANPLLCRQFSHEAQAWTKLAAHPNVVTAFDVREFHYSPCILMEYVDGGSLAERIIAARGHVPLAEAFAIAVQTCWAVAFAHENGYVHRDLKPSNVLLTGDGTAKVTDFGLVAHRGAEPGNAVGTWAYMAPEVWDGKHGPAGDAYAFGVTLCMLFCGQLPLDYRADPRYSGAPHDSEDSARLFRALHQSAEPLDPLQIRPDLPAEVGAIISACLAKQPEDRPASFDEIANSLIRASKGAPHLSKPTQTQLDRQQMDRRAWALLRLGSSAEFRGDLPEAESLYRECELLFIQCADQDGLCVCYNLLGNIRYAHSDYTAALSLYEKSLGMPPSTDCSSPRANSLLGIGNIHYMSEQHSEALAHYRQALEMFANLEIRTGIAKCHNNMGNILHDTGDADAALDAYSESLGIYVEMNDSAGIAACHLNMGEVLQSTGNYGPALRHCEDSLRIYEEIGESEGMAACLYNLGEIHLKLRGYTESLSYYRRSLRKREEMGDVAGIQRCTEGIGTADDALNRR